MGLRDKFRAQDARLMDLPDILEIDDPVNFHSVVTWMAALSDTEYKTITQAIQVTRDAQKKLEKLVEEGSIPAISIVVDQAYLSGAFVDDKLDDLLRTDSKDLRAGVLADTKKPTKNRKKPEAKK